MSPRSPKPLQRSRCQRGSRCHRGPSPAAEVLAGMSQGRVSPSAGSQEPIERENKVKAPQEALASDVKVGNFRGVMFASV